MSRRQGVTVVELLVVIAIVGLLLGLLMTAVQKVRSAAARLQCANNLRQIGLALHQYHDATRSFPPGVTIKDPNDAHHHLSWRIRLAPFIEQEEYWRQTERDFVLNPFPNVSPYHAGASIPLNVFSCPMDGRVQQTQRYAAYEKIALASYLGIGGIDYQFSYGIFYRNSRTRMADVTDGLSNTLMVGERPPSNDYRYGWLYFGTGQGGGSCDHTLGVREIARPITGCPPGPYHFQPKQLGVPCAFMHFWSLHDGGGHFLMADASAHFLTYNADAVLPALATRAGNDVVNGGW
jgi:prepilin-type N-terminal cleavage/methylation domain-containing protein